MENSIYYDYIRMFGEIPMLPIGVTWYAIKDLMEDAIIAKKPLTQDEVNEAMDKFLADNDVDFK